MSGTPSTGGSVTAFGVAIRGDGGAPREGARGAAEGTIVVQMRNDGRVGVEINGKGDPGLTQRLTDAYNSRMGR